MMMAGTCADAQAIDSGRPLKTTRTTGFPVATMASRSFSWFPGRLRWAREEASPELRPLSPSAITTTSAPMAAATASGNPESVVPETSVPRANDNGMPPLDARLDKALRSVTMSPETAWQDHEPSMSVALSANGPISAIFLPGPAARGSSGPSPTIRFSRSTNDSSAARRASASPAGVAASPDAAGSTT